MSAVLAVGGVLRRGEPRQTDFDRHVDQALAIQDLRPPVDELRARRDAKAARR